MARTFHKICTHCLAEFTVCGYPNQKYCCIECREEAGKKRQRERKTKMVPKTINCGLCGCLLNADGTEAKLKGKMM